MVLILKRFQMLSLRFSSHFETTGAVENNVNLKDLMNEDGILFLKKSHKVKLTALEPCAFRSLTL